MLIMKISDKTNEYFFQENKAWHFVGTVSFEMSYEMLPHPPLAPPTKKKKKKKKKNRIWHCLQIVSKGDNLHEISKPIFWEKSEKYQFFIC